MILPGLVYKSPSLPPISEHFFASEQLWLVLQMQESERAGSHNIKEGKPLAGSAI